MEKEKAQRQLNLRISARDREPNPYPVSEKSPSEQLKMCKWHRIACALPLIPQSVDLFDAYVYHLEHYDWIVAAATITITLILFLIEIYKVFMTDDGRIC